MHAPFPLLTILSTPMHTNLRRLGLVFALFATQNPSLYAQTKAQSSSYFYQLGVLVGEIRTIEHLGDLCARVYPDTSTANQQAVDAWKAKYGATIRDVDTQYAGLRRTGGAWMAAATRKLPCSWIDSRTCWPAYRRC